MLTNKAKKHIFTCIFLLQIALTAPAALAHDGHGMEASSHWHATDGWGWVVGLALVAAMWWGGRKP